MYIYNINTTDNNTNDIDTIFNESESISIDLIKKLNLSCETINDDKLDFAEHSTPSELLITMMILKKLL